MLGKGLESLIPQGGYNPSVPQNIPEPQPPQPAYANSGQVSAQQPQYPQNYLQSQGQLSVPSQPAFASQYPAVSQPSSNPAIFYQNVPTVSVPAQASSSVQPAPYVPSVPVISSAPGTPQMAIGQNQVVPPANWSDNGAMVRASIGINQIDNIDPIYSSESDYSKSDGKVYQIDVNQIFPNPHQPRRYFDEDALNDLANSIREFGIIQPLVITRVDKNGQEAYQLIAGERRLLAAKKVGLKTVPVVIKSVGADKERLELAIIENIQRENLNPLEAARSYARLQDEFGYTQREIASRMGKSRETIANNLRLLNLPTEIQRALEEGKINESHARILLQVDDIGRQREMFDSIMKFKPSVRELKSQFKRGVTSVAPKRSSSFNPELMSLQSKLEETLGTKVQITDDGDSGKITINYYSPEELNNLINKLSNPWSDNY